MDPLTFTQNAHKTPQNAHKTPQTSTSYVAYRHLTNYSHLGPKLVWTQIIYFGPFRVLVQKGVPETEVVLKRPFISTGR